jgi:hypothetical protein
LLKSVGTVTGTFPCSTLYFIQRGSRNDVYIRDAASMELSRAELIVAVSSFGDMMNQGSLEHVGLNVLAASGSQVGGHENKTFLLCFATQMHSAFHRVLVGILRWCDERAAMKGWLPGIGGHEARSSVSQATSTPFRGGGASSEDPQWTGRQAVDLFESWGLTRDTLAILHTYLTEVSAYRKQQLQESVASVDGTNACILSSRALSTAERLLVCSSFLLSAVDGCSDAAAHYDLVLQRSDPGESGSVTLEYDDSPASATASVSTYKICLWCMTPTLAFRDVAKLARCVILTSGTLSPLESFALELGNQFPLQLQAPHVVDLKRQLWAGVVAESMWASSVELSSVESRGASIAHAPLTFPWTVNPSQQKILRVELNGTFAHATQLQYLEGVGTAILTIAAATPNGVLCFFPSFAMLSRCIEHWKRAKLEAAPTEDLVGWTPPIFSSAQPETFRSRRSPWGKTDYGGEARTCSDGDGKPGTLWNALWRVKRIFYESSSRSAGAEDFSQLLSTFQLVVDATRSHNSAPLNHPTSSSDTCSSTAAEAVAVSASANGAGDTAAEPEETRSTVVAAREDSKNALAPLAVRKVDSLCNPVVADAAADSKCTGAILFAVCRGKASEGIDFSDSYCRSVLIVGIPYPALLDHSVRLKREYQDNLRRKVAANAVGAAQVPLPLSGGAWYSQQAFRALNQAIGVRALFFQ